MFEAFAELVRDNVTRTAHSCTCWISALDHEIVDDSVKDYSVIEIFLGQVNEILHCVGSKVGIKFDSESAHVGIEVCYRSFNFFVCERGKTHEW